MLLSISTIAIFGSPCSPLKIEKSDPSVSVLKTTQSSRTNAPTLLSFTPEQVTETLGFVDQCVRHFSNRSKSYSTISPVHGPGADSSSPLSSSAVFEQ